MRSHKITHFLSLNSSLNINEQPTWVQFNSCKVAKPNLFLTEINFNMLLKAFNFNNLVQQCIKILMIKKHFSFLNVSRRRRQQKAFPKQIWEMSFW